MSLFVSLKYITGKVFKVFILRMMMKGSKYKIAIIDDSLVHFRLPLHQAIAKTKEIDSIVYFCTMNDCSGRYRYETSSKRGFGLKLHGFKHTLLKNYYPFREASLPYGLWNFGIVLELMKHNYDAVIIYGYSSFTKKLALFAAKISKTPIIFREEINEISGGPLKKFLKKFIYKILFKLPDAFLCSYTENKEFYKKFGALEEKLFTHPCAVDNVLYRRLAKKMNRNKLRQKMGIPQGANVFLSVGTIDKRKGVFDTLRAFEKIGEGNNYLIYLGEGPEKEKLQKYIKESRIANVRFFTFKANPEGTAKIYSIADIFIIASISDPSPKVLNEAMNFSLPIIASTSVGTAYDLVKEGKNGYIFETGNINKLFKVMKRLSLDIKLKKKMGEESLKIVSKWNFNEDVRATLKALDYIYKNEKNC